MMKVERTNRLSKTQSFILVLLIVKDLNLTPHRDTVEILLKHPPETSFRSQGSLLISPLAKCRFS